MLLKKIILIDFNAVPIINMKTGLFFTLTMFRYIKCVCYNTCNAEGFRKKHYKPN